MTFEGIPFGSTDGTKKNRITLLDPLNRLLRKRHTRRVDRCAAQEHLFVRKVNVFNGGYGVKHLDSFIDDFRANAIPFDHADCIILTHAAPFSAISFWA